MQSYLIRNAKIVNSGKIFFSDLLIRHGRIERISPSISNIQYAFKEIDIDGKLLLPGIIDAHVHFREPGLTYKADMASESRAAVAGGVTTCLEMPNTIPQTTTVSELEAKYALAANKSIVNIGFFIGATNDNLSEIEKAGKAGACGIKLFLGASTGNMLVDDIKSIESLFRNADLIITIHSEDEKIIQENMAIFKNKYGDQIPPSAHALIRSEEACFKATSFAFELSKKHNTRIHLAHLSTNNELSLLDKSENKKITSEVSIHHLIYNDTDYARLGNLIKCNPSIKSAFHQEALLNGLNEGLIDIIATDHAPHTIEEKRLPYTNCPSGIPFVQHSLICMLDLYDKRQITLERIVDTMCHTPAKIYGIADRGHIEEGYYADICIVNQQAQYKVAPQNILYKCGWSPVENMMFNNSIEYTFVGGNLVFEKGVIFDDVNGMKPEFRY
jgi:dihydroorotase